ncbi:MAG: hypothetical protein HY899_20045 [Deltaproteobacteria bacterium]|nr:hypothetical protein [Deltaproteobacteria bacterium]
MSSATIRQCGTLFGIVTTALFSICGVPGVVSAEFSSVEVTVEPASPSFYQPTSLLISGTSSDTCGPELVEATSNGASVDVVLLRSKLWSCGQAFSFWKVEADLGLLPIGFYSAAVRVVDLPPPFPSQSYTIGGTDFEVKERFGGTSHGAAVKGVVCKNFTSGQRIVIRGAEPPWNCEASGLVVNSGDKVGFRVRGAVP